VANTRRQGGRKVKGYDRSGVIGTWACRLEAVYNRKTRLEWYSQCQSELESWVTSVNSCCQEILSCRIPEKDSDKGKCDGWQVDVSGAR
jgi:hypothetical protein